MRWMRIGSGEFRPMIGIHCFVRLVIFMQILGSIASIERPLYGQSSPQYGKAILYRFDYDENKCSYHFSTKSHGSVLDGEFYFASDGKLCANNVGQLGLIDLGPSAEFDPTTVDIPAEGFYRLGIEAKPRHTYLTPARRGEDNRYILFRINYDSLEGKALGLEYYVMETGKIVVQTNQNTKFIISGPRSFTGNGTHWQKANALAGTYTIVYEPISGFDTPPSESKVLQRGATIAYSADFKRVPPPTPEPQPDPGPEPSPGPKPSSKFMGIPIEIMAAFISALATIVAAYFGYCAIVKKKNPNRINRNN